MREIKFRAWEPDHKTMVYFDNVKAANDIYQANHLLILMAGKHEKGDCLMQYTGLKDKNGVEIYEGDVVKAHGEHPAQIGYLRGSFTIKHSYGNGLSISEVATDRYQVIGNICENPELLESK